VTRADFDQEWAVLQTSNAGERGIFSPARMKYRGLKVRANPCVEIGLTWQDAVNAYKAQQDALKAKEAQAAGAEVAEVKYSLKEIAKTGGGQFCNLTNVILRPWDNLESARAKVALAAFLGTLQASCTRFNGLRAGWTDITRRDALLGVGLSGQADCPQVTSSIAKLASLNALAVDANAWWAGVFGISAAAGVTCGKPDGNSSAFLGCCFSGIHAHHDRYYLQRITVSAQSPICAVLREAGVPSIPSELGATEPSAWLFEFPMAAAPGALLRTQETALGLLDRLDVVNRGWLGEKGHNQSVTVNVRPDEWDGVKERIWERGDAGELGGVSFFPDEGAVYYGQPRTSLTADEYEARLAALPVVDWGRLAEYETGVSEGAQTLACGGGACELR
jgi:ribonucleoside-triphosphate reductase (thioredoxin)